MLAISDFYSQRLMSHGADIGNALTVLLFVENRRRYLDVGVEVGIQRRSVALQKTFARKIDLSRKAEKR